MTDKGCYMSGICGTEGSVGGMQIMSQHQATKGVLKFDIHFNSPCHHKSSNWYLHSLF